MSFKLKTNMKLCRLCASPIKNTSSNDLFDKSNKCMLEQIKELTGISVKNVTRHRLPHFFCSDCKTELPRACEFRRKIIKTQNYFRSNEYKNKYKAVKRLDPIVADSVIPDDNSIVEDAVKGKLLLDDEREDYDPNASKYYEIFIKDEIRDTTSETDVETPIGLSEQKLRKLNTNKKSFKSSVNLINSSSHTSNNESQKFDAVYLPLKKEENEMNKQASDDGSDKDALEDITADETDDPDFETDHNTKKKTTRKRLVTKTTKAQSPKDPRKNPLYCFICNTTLKTSHAFKVHCRKLHKGEKIFKCDSCEETFLRIKSLIRHCRIHQGGKLFECRYCDMSFNAPTTRIHHERAKHTKDWPFLCPICGKAFITTTRGKEHMTVHTKERPYKCELCKTAYLQRNNFKKHRRSELHKNNEKKLKENVNNPSTDNKTDTKEN